MKAVFLDFDGVLNSVPYCRVHHEPGVTIDATRMALLQKIIEATEAQIVLSTSWKEHWDADPNLCDNISKEINRIFYHHGIKIYDKISDVEKSRSSNIAGWLSEHKEVTCFVVLDDVPMDEGVLKNHCVLTSRLRNGLDEEDAECAIEILKGRERNIYFYEMFNRFSFNSTNRV